MKTLLTFILITAGITYSCVKGDRKNTTYKIEASGSNITSVLYTTRDHGSKQVFNVNSSTWEFEWKKGYKSNDIKVMIECDGPGTIKIYRKGDVVEEKSGTNTVNAAWKGDSN